MASKQRTTPRCQLIMGGWEHAQGLDVGAYLQWLDTWVKGVDTGIQATQTPAERCPATGLPSVNDSDPCRLTRHQQASVPGSVYTLHHGPKAPSALNLPLLPRRHFGEVRAGVLTALWNEGQRSLMPADGKAARLSLPLAPGATSTTPAQRRPDR